MPVTTLPPEVSNLHPGDPNGHLEDLRTDAQLAVLGVGSHHTGGALE